MTISSRLLISKTVMSAEEINNKLITWIMDLPLYKKNKNHQCQLACMAS